MKKHTAYPIALFSVAALLAACLRHEEPPADSHVTTAEEQARLTPDEVLRQFKEGNQRFHSGQITRRNHNEQVRKSAPGQFPKAMSSWGVSPGTSSMKICSAAWSLPARWPVPR